MNKYKFIIKFIANKGDNGKYKWNLLFPFVGVIIGCMTVALTLSIMEGMEYAIFTKLENISFPGKLANINSVNSDTLEEYLNRFDSIIAVDEQSNSSGISGALYEGFSNIKIFKKIVSLNLPEKYFP